MSLTDPATLGEGDQAKLEMKLIADKEAKTLTLIDRGCGTPRARRAARPPPPNRACARATAQAPRQDGANPKSARPHGRATRLLSVPLPLAVQACPRRI